MRRVAAFALVGGVDVFGRGSWMVGGWIRRGEHDLKKLTQLGGWHGVEHRRLVDGTFQGSKLISRRVGVAESPVGNEGRRAAQTLGPGRKAGGGGLLLAACCSSQRMLSRGRKEPLWRGVCGRDKDWDGDVAAYEPPK